MFAIDVMIFNDVCKPWWYCCFNIKGSDYCCIISLISKNEAINLLLNADLTKKSRTL